VVVKENTELKKELEDKDIALFELAQFFDVIIKLIQYCKNHHAEAEKSSKKKRRGNSVS
jgi:hypothetical protein